MLDFCLVLINKPKNKSIIKKIQGKRAEMVTHSKELESRLNQIKSDFELTRERENTYARERAELATQLAEAQKAKANVECELETHQR